MNRIVTALSISALALVATSPVWGQAPKQPPTPAQAIRRTFTNLNREIMAMANDFPADKYDFRPTKEVRSFAEVMVHIASGNVFGAKAGRGENVKWDELDPKNYKNKDDVVALMQASMDNAVATLTATPDESFSKTLGPWLSVIEHDAEHFGLLAAYYRLNGLVPPQSRPQPKAN